MGEFRKGYEQVKQFLFVFRKKFLQYKETETMIINTATGTQEIVDFNKPTETLDIIRSQTENGPRKITPHGANQKYTMLNIDPGWAKLVMNNSNHVVCRLLLCSDGKHRVLVEPVLLDEKKKA